MSDLTPTAGGGSDPGPERGSGPGSGAHGEPGPPPEAPVSAGRDLGSEAGHGGLAVEPSSGLPTEARLFFGLGAFSALLAVVYGVATGRSFTGIEYGGLLALIAGAVFSVFFGTFLTLLVRRIQTDFEALEEGHAEGDPVAHDVLYLPAESIWPIGIGLGLSLTLAGVPLGLWVLIPGIALFLHSLIGFAQQSRARR